MAELPTVRIGVIGDAGVGKTSLITATATETFSESPPPVLPDTRLPAQCTPEGVPLRIIDTSSKPEDRSSVEEKIRSCDVIVLLFTLDKPDSLRRVSSYWLPELRRLKAKAPVTLVLAKTDLVPNDQVLQELKADKLDPIVQRNRQVETCMDCSAKGLSHVGEVFYTAMKAVIYPSAPLFGPAGANGIGQIKPAAINALNRVFMLCDKDKDGALSNKELNAFQTKCFSAPLQPEELVGIKKVVADKVPGGINQKGLTLDGFIFLNALFIERGRLETTWAILRCFGYGNNLRLNESEIAAARLVPAPDQVAELTPDVRKFLLQKFKDADTDRDQLLSPEELQHLWSTAPDSPWQGPRYSGTMVETAGRGCLTREGFVSMWTFMAATDHLAAVEYLVYLGYEGPITGILQLKGRRQELTSRSTTKAVPRSFLKGLVFGGESSGKSTLLRGLVGTAGQGSHSSDEALPHSAVNRVDCSSGTSSSSGFRENSKAITLAEPGQTWLQLSEVSMRAAEGMLASSNCSEQLLGYDVAAFLFDCSRPQSFREARLLLEHVATASGNTMPCVLVATKDDLGMHTAVEKDCGHACLALHLPLPISVSLQLGEGRSVYQELIKAAQQPSRAIPETPSLKAAQQFRKTMRQAMLWTGVGACIAVGGYIVYRSVRNPIWTNAALAPSECV
ncbi:hypothetical protein WJX84_010427 [Apatococcus fuscideae]|uniref:Mitochondrial Rho GTPase n=1 Tax=Apatococcus fuscideae TaxID=2026836 RepID=A0AAW1SM83_9CHLO